MQKRILSALVVALLAVALVIQPALAAAPKAELRQDENTYGLTCVDGVCKVQLDLGVGSELLPHGAWLTFMQGALSALPGDLGIAVQDDVTISLPTVNLSLVDAELVLTLEDDGKVATFAGSAMVPVPTFGLLGDWQMVTPARLSVGYDRGEALARLNAPLQAERRYFYIDAEAGLHLMTDGMELASPTGQRATVVVDFAQPLAYIDGQVTLHTDGQIAFIREALGPIADSGGMPADLPLRQSVNVHLQGQAGREVEPKLTVAGGYRVDGGLVGKWLQIDATPLLAQGHATLGPNGVVLEGIARTSVQPEEWLDSGAQAQLFVPFGADESASLSVGADVAAPAIGLNQEASATVTGEAGWLQRTGDAALVGVLQGWNTVGSAAESSYSWMSDGVGAGWTFTQQQWCAMSGRCDAASVAIAEK